MVAARDLDKKYLKTEFPPEPVVQIQNNITELFPTPLQNLLESFRSTKQDGHQSSRYEIS